MKTLPDLQGVDQLIATHLKPQVAVIDQQGHYPVSFLKLLGQSGFYQAIGRSPKEILTQQISLIEQVSQVCVSTSFSLWCHLAGLTYIRYGQSHYLKREVLPALEKGELLAGTGLSNPMKFYAGMEKLRLKAKQTAKGYRLSGSLPFVSNLAADHWFGVIADAGHKRIVVLVPCQTEGLVLQEKVDFMALNGTGTYSCQFCDVEVPGEWIAAEDADLFVQKIRPIFLLTQAAIALGLVKACMTSMLAVSNKQNGINQYVDEQPQSLSIEWESLRQRVYQLAEVHHDPDNLQSILQVRLQAAELSIRAAQAELLHKGAAGYLQHSATNRRLREAYFMAILTPAIKQLNKMLAHWT